MRSWLPVLVFLSRMVSAQAPTTDELRARRTAVSGRLGAGLLLVHAAGGLKRWEDTGFHQDPGFLYLTGFRNLQNAILVLDGPRSESWLFVPQTSRTDSGSFAGFDRRALTPGRDAERQLGIDHVVPWDQFGAVVDSLAGLTPTLAFYVDAGGQTGRQLGRQSNPAGFAPVMNPYLTWRHAVAERWPSKEIRDAWPVLDEARSIKSPAEIAALKKAAAVTAAGLEAAARTIAPNVTQRAVEGATVAAAFAAGSDGPSLWPWIRSGPESNTSRLFDAFYDYRNLDRPMQSGEIVRVDLGFDYSGYKGDFGRTLPVSGRFSPIQRDALALLTGAYLAGVASMREGSTPDSVAAASMEYVRNRLSSIQQSELRAAAEQLLNVRAWVLHGLGLDLAEGTPKVFRAGNVICFEPSIRVGGEDLFVEDTFLITKDGHELINPPEPYDAPGLEKLMARSRGRR